MIKTAIAEPIGSLMYCACLPLHTCAHTGTHSSQKLISLRLIFHLATEDLRPAGNPNVLVCERGTMFGYSDLVVDPRNFVLMRDAACPVTADVTHALQQPAGRTLEVRTPGNLQKLIPDP